MGWVVNVTSARSLPPGKGPLLFFGWEAEWAPEPVWTQRLQEKFAASTGDRTPVAQSVVRHYTDWVPELIFSWCNHGNQGMYFTKGSEILLIKLNK
jgi:hypothetical protein